MAKTIKGNNDGKKGGNDTYTIPGRGSDIPRGKIVGEVKKGQHPNHSIYEINGVEYVRSNPNSKGGNNVNTED